jgi:hypothetical protein
MSTQNNKPLSNNNPTTKISSTQAGSETPKSPEVIKLAPSMWLRAMTDFDAPFGHDGLPTVWG